MLPIELAQLCGANASSDASYIPATISAAAFSAPEPETTAVQVSRPPGVSLETKCSHLIVSSLFDHGTSTRRANR